MSSIPSGQDLRGTTAMFGVNLKLDLQSGEEMADFGTLVRLGHDSHGQHFDLVGWLGADGKIVPVVATLTGTPEQSVLNLFWEEDGELKEYLVAERCQTVASGKTYYKGTSHYRPTRELYFHPMPESASLPV